MNLRNKNALAIAVQENTKQLKPTFELTKEQREGLTQASEVALAIIATCGVATIAIIAPNLLGAIDKIYRYNKRQKLTFKEKQAKTANTFYYLKRYGLIDVRPEKGQWVIALTNLGKKRLEKLELKTVSIAKAKRWDGCWWLVAADIPTKQYRWAADLFRKKVKNLGFYPLQRTLWMYPHNPIKEIQFLSDQFNIGRFVTVMKVSEIGQEDRHKLKKFFNL